MRSIALLLPLAAACFTPPAPELDVEELSYTNAYTHSDDIVLRPFTYAGLLCPDGSSATFYAVYRTSLTAPAPFVVVFHGGSFDYVKNPIPEDPLYGDHYSDDDRLSGTWANRRVFQTLGLLEPDPTEVALGTLPAALAEAGTVAVYPANCWGDLWHNEFGYERNAEDEYIFRNGRALAWAMVALASADAPTSQHWRDAFGVEAIPVEIDWSGVYMAGIGEGGRGVMEVLRREQLVQSLQGASSVIPPVRGLVMDSTMDNFFPIMADASRFPGLATGISRIYPDDYDSGAIGWWSMQRYLTDTGLEGSLQVYWSTNDPQVPTETMEGLVGVYANNPFGARFTVTDTGLPQHGYINGDQTAAIQAVNELLGR